ncbi:MAG: hypothetical protein EPN49_00740 [Rhodanobacter sp.]|nr:MAG: hypothetical protein EPN49_00740 [Rhodanobacter sp.]
MTVACRRRPVSVRRMTRCCQQETGDVAAIAGQVPPDRSDNMLDGVMPVRFASTLLSLLAGFITTFPMNWWLVSGHLTPIMANATHGYRMAFMSPSFHMRRTKHPSLFWLVALLLLWQQMALATSLCPMPGGYSMAAVATTAAQPDCMHGMHEGQGHANPAMCAQHCAQGSLVQSDARSPNVPGSVLPPLAPAMPIVASLPRAESSFASAFQLHADHPPLRLLFCSLLV